MTDSFVQVAPDSTGKLIDTEELTVGSSIVERQRFILAGQSAGSIVNPMNSAPVGTEYAVPVRNIPSGTQVMQGVQDTRVTGTITSPTSQVGNLAVTQRNVVTITISGTYAGVTFVIEASDDGGTSWFPLQCIDNATGAASAVWTPGTNASASYDSAIGGYTHLRVRATAWTSGSASVGMTAQSFAYDPVVAALTQSVDIDYTATSVSAANGDLFSVDCRGIKSIFLQLTGTWAGTVTFQTSVDGTTWQSTPAFNVSGPSLSSGSTATSNGIFLIPVLSRFVRARVTSYTSGTVAGVYRTSTSMANALGAQVTTYAAASANLMGDVSLQYRAGSTGAASTTSIMSPATPAGGSIKGSAGKIVGLHLQNSSSGVRSVKFFNATSVVMGTTSAMFEMDIPAGAQVFLDMAAGIAFSTGIMWAVTSAKGLTDNTSTGLAANDVTGAVFYA